MAEVLGQNVVVENRPGASGQIGASAVAKATPDGYTLMLDASSFAVNPALFPKLPYDSSKAFRPIGVMALFPNVVLVNAQVPAKNIAELIALAKSRKDAIAYASSGNGSAQHLAGALFESAAHVDMVHIPFRGGAPAIQSVIAGDTQVTFGTPPSVLPMIQAARLKGLAVSTKNSTPLVPGLPGMQEAKLPEYAIEFWYGLFVPVGTPPAVIKKIFDATQTAMAQPSVKAALAREGTDVSVSASPDQFATFLDEDAKFWVNLVKSAGVKLD
jgi:tripartite-type tricarboxylate transporter receptor subunit TctC